MKYKVGDKVRIKSLDWYNENKDNNREIKFENGIFTTLKSTFLGQIMTIEEITLGKQYILMEDRYKTLWTDEMIEGLVEDNFESNANSITQSESDAIEKAKNYWDSIKDAWICPKGYEFKDENGNVINATKIVLERKKPKYPKTYEECCEILSITDSDYYLRSENGGTISSYIFLKLQKINKFTKLIICREAYWKIAGEEMGLGKPWEPDYKKERYVIHRYIDVIVKGYRQAGLMEHFILEFPTEEMRDAFYEAFKELIEECKELL